ncbi:cation:proton antiporter [Elizabethkingia sp. JS20170427COW]|nr:cation:proton antiporter [Elizabethkingia sp. JS20170427COW]
MHLLNIHSLTLPLEDPILKFLVVLIIILSAPLLLNKIKVPHLLGLIIAGAVIGPNGLNILPRDSSIVVSGTTGLLYIMFLAGLEIDMGDFKKNKWKSLTFGLYTFCIPLGLGILLSHYILGFPYLTSLIFASIFSTHTLISYPIVGKLGLVKNRAVNITVGGTMITDIFALLILAVVVGVTQGDVNTAFWVKMAVSFTIFGIVVLGGFPIIGRWFFKKVQDKISQYIFVLVMIYLAALFAEIAGLEAIIGAFFAGLALNRLIPHTSILMNRIEFVGNAIFIPFFLISVGMLIDFSVFFKDAETIKVIVLMTVVAVVSKYIAALLTQKTFKFNPLERGLIFGLSTSHAAATLAVVMVGYNIIIGETDSGKPIRLLDESVLNGSIVLILISCTLSSFITQSAGEKMLLEDDEEKINDTNQPNENILLALSYDNTVDPMVNLGVSMKSKNQERKLYALNVINDAQEESSEKHSEKLLKKATDNASAIDIQVNTMKRYDDNIMRGISNVVKEQKISDLIFGLEKNKGFSPSFLLNFYNSKLFEAETNIFIYHAFQPMATIKKYTIVIPPNSEKNRGFLSSLLKIWNLAKNSGAKFVFLTTENIIQLLKRIIAKSNIDAEFKVHNQWRNLEPIMKQKTENHAFVFFMFKPEPNLFFFRMKNIPEMINKNLTESNYLLVYPYSTPFVDEDSKLVSNHGDYVKIGNMISSLFRT